MIYNDDLDRFWSKVIVLPGKCWNWIGQKDKDGYGVFTIKNKKYRAHRFSYEINRSKIPRGLVIDHLCKNTSCINPNHMEIVTNKVNILRGNGAGSINAKKTHCSKGHPLSGNNLLKRKQGYRRCRKCYNQSRKDRRAKNGL